MSDLKYEGIFAVLVTPLTDAAELDEAALRHLVDFCCEQRFSAAVVLASNSEYAYLSEAEKLSVIRIAAEQAKGRIPVVAGVSAPGTLQAVALARQAREAGCQAALAELPRYYHLETEDVLQYFRVLAGEGGLPLVFYYSPDTSGLVLTPEQIVKVAELEGVRATVLALISVPFIREVLAVGKSKNLAIMAGTGLVLQDSLEAGACGLCCPLPTLFPAQIKGIFEAHDKRDSKRCGELQDRVLEAAVSFFSRVEPFVFDAAAIFRALASRSAPNTPRRAQPVHAFLKEALRLQGHLSSNMVKPPFRPASQQQSEIARKIVEKVESSG
jgi:dihydrodipicolinate synthase/N-acetylneuraminate lyase